MPPSPSPVGPLRPLLAAGFLVGLWACGNSTVVGPQTLEITTTSLADAAQATPYSQTLEATGADGALTWSVASGLPPGLDLSAAGDITGTPPDSLATWTFQVRVVSADRQVAVKTLSITTVPLTFRARGVVDRADAPLSVAVGDTFTVTYSFDVTTADANPSVTRGEYLAVRSLLVQIGTYACTVDLTRSINPYHILVFDDNSTPAQDRYSLVLFEETVTGREGSLLGCPPLAGMNAGNQTALLLLTDASATALSSDALPSAPPNLAAFTRSMTFAFYDPNLCDPILGCDPKLVTASVDSISVVPVS